MSVPYPRKVPLPVPDGYISTAEAMKVVAVSKGTFYRYKGEFDDFPTAITLGGSAYYKRDDLLAWKRRHVGE